MNVGAVRDMRGFSFGAAVVLEELDAAEASQVQLFADPSRFTETEIHEAAVALAENGLRVEAGLYLQCSIEPAAVVVLKVAADLLISIGGSAIWEGIKGLVARERSEVRFEVEKPNGEVIKALVRTSDQEVARRAVETLGPAVEGAVELAYADDEWKDVSKKPPGIDARSSK